MQTYNQGRERLVAACDEDIVGATLREGNVELHVDPGFYDGSRVDADALRFQLRKCTVANLVGDGAVGLAVEMGMVDPSQVMRIDGVAHAQWALLF